MDFYAMNSGYRQDKLIEGWNSLIWTERYRDCGEFSMKTPDVRNTRMSLPLGSFVTLGDTRELCMVESHTIEKDENGFDILTVEGRSYETFFENRPTLIAPNPIKASGTDDTNATVVTNSSAAYVGARLVDNARSDQLSANNVIANMNGTDTSYVDPNEVYQDRFISRGDTYTALLKVLDEAGVGIQNYRPSNAGFVVTVNVYSSFIKTSDDFNAKVALDVLSGHFAGPVKYGWDIKNYRTCVYVASKNYFRTVYASGASGFTDTAHRAGLLDLPEITQTGSNIPKMLDARGRAYLNQHKKVFKIEGRVSPNLPFIYKKDYGLGDRIKVRGDYGAEATMRVTEYTRAEDENGEIGYPTLS